MAEQSLVGTGQVGTGQVGTVRVASDVGGTFTDCIAYDAATGRLDIAKVPTTPENRAVGTVDGLKIALQRLDVKAEQVGYVGHGMTTATNAVIQRRGARIAFITNFGFRDILEIGRQNRPRLYDFRVVRAPSLAARRDRFTVAGRLDYRGMEIEPLDTAAVDAIADRIAAEPDIAAVGVCLLHAYANPAHEQQVKTILQQRLPDRFITLSSDLSREFREYERASTTALNAYLVPVMDRYLGSLVERLQAAETGLAVPKSTPVLVMEASGGLMTVETARAKPVHTILSGPAGGVVAAAEVAARTTPQNSDQESRDGIGNIITMDMGGTSTDISLVLAGQPQITQETTIEALPIRVPVIDINAIGAGGGSIAWIDAGGALRVGPQSAEAVPGPAAYGRGGTLPTVTDANVVLGRLGADTALGGDMALQKDAAAAAIQTHIAGPLGMDLVTAAAGILRVADANMERGIRVVSVERGYDPREFVLVPFGGAGPLHGAAIARHLSIPRQLVPPTPGILCALGMLMSDLRHDRVVTQIRPLAEADADALAQSFQPLYQEVSARLDADRVPETDRQIKYFIDLRYIGQSYELTMPLTAVTADEITGLAAAFHDAHRQKFGHADPAAAVEMVNLRIVATGRRPRLQLPALPQGSDTPPAAAKRGTRNVYFDGGAGWQETTVWQREALLAGNRIQGPAVIEELSSTTLLAPGDCAEVEAVGNLIIDVAPV